jgi:hypothetical protein
MNKRFFFAFVAAMVVGLFAGCAVNPYEGNSKTRSDALLKQQFDAAEKRRAASPDGRIIFAGFALNSQSKAFRNDVLTAEKGVLSIDPNALVFKLNNPVLGQDADWPFATTENVEQVLLKVGAMARPQDKVVVLLTTHGNVDMLSVNFNDKEYPHINGRALNQWLAGLRGKPTLLLVSACFSGSFLQTLSGPSRVVLTAAARDRSSFGCQFQSTNTYFVDALLNQSSLKDRSIEQLMEQAKIAIDKRERDGKLSPPSLPQMFVGTAAKTWANVPLKTWLEGQ